MLLPAIPGPTAKASTAPALSHLGAGERHEWVCGGSWGQAASQLSDLSHFYCCLMATICYLQGSRVPAQRHLPPFPLCFPVHHGMTHVCIKNYNIHHPPAPSPNHTHTSFVILNGKPNLFGKPLSRALQHKGNQLAYQLLHRPSELSPRGEGPLHPQTLRLNGLSGSPAEQRNPNLALLRPAGPQARLLRSWWKKSPPGRKTWGPPVPPALQAAVGLYDP